MMYESRRTERRIANYRMSPQACCCAYSSAGSSRKQNFVLTGHFLSSPDWPHDDPLHKASSHAWVDLPSSTSGAMVWRPGVGVGLGNGVSHGWGCQEWAGEDKD